MLSCLTFFMQMLGRVCQRSSYWTRLEIATPLHWSWIRSMQKRGGASTRPLWSGCTLWTSSLQGNPSPRVLLAFEYLQVIRRSSFDFLTSWRLLSNFWQSFLSATVCDARKVRVTGRGIQANGVRVKDLADFKVHTENAGQGILDVKVIGPG